MSGWKFAQEDPVANPEVTRRSDYGALERKAALGRSRVIAMAAGAMALICPVIGVQLWTAGASWLNLPLAALGTAGFLGAWWLGRRVETMAHATGLFCTTFLLVASVRMFHHDGAIMVYHAVFVTVPLVALFGVSPRAGLGFAALSVSLVVVAQWLHAEGLVLPDNMLPPPPYWAFLPSAVSCIGLAVAVGWAYRSNHQGTVACLRASMHEAALSEAQLLALVENTSDLICALDRDYRLVVWNSSFRRMFEATTGEKIRVGGKILSWVPLEERPHWQALLDQVFRERRMIFVHQIKSGEQTTYWELSVASITKGEEPVGITVFARDITGRKEAERRLRKNTQQIADLARSAGIAEISTGILHNVGNVLNSVNVSIGTATREMRQSKLNRLWRILELIDEGSAQPGFLRDDPRGRQLGLYVRMLAERLDEERQTLLAEMASLERNVEHIKQIVSTQQQYARIAGSQETVPIAEIVETALQMDNISFQRRNIRVETAGLDIAAFPVERHKVLQILVNLLTNAKHAVEQTGRSDGKTVRVVAEVTNDSRAVRLSVEDNGVGIDPEVIPRLFEHGFTTKREGNGFGLHISANTAREFGGSLSCHSDGPGRGARFVLEIPFEPARSAA